MQIGSNGTLQAYGMAFNANNYAGFKNWINSMIQLAVG